MRGFVVLTCAALQVAPGLAAQGDPGATLWRVAGQTLAIPPALAEGGTAVLWNPAQPPTARLAVAADAVQAAQDIAAVGLLAAVRARAGVLGSVGLVYGRMRIGDLVRTTTSPAPEPGPLDFHTQVVGANWARTFGDLDLGISGARHSTRLADDDVGRWTLDAGARLRLGRRVRLAAATHFLSRLDTNDPAQDVYAGIDLVAWSGRPWAESPPSVIRVRYGTAFAHGFSADHHLGAGVAFGDLAAIDVLATYEGGYAVGGWQPVVAVTIGVGKYRAAVAANPGAAGLGPAFRIGLEARFP